MNERREYAARKILGWIAVTVSAALASLWAAWGIIENFVEGWYYGTLWTDLALMVAQYLLPMILFVALSAVALRWPRAGSMLHVAAAAAAVWFLRNASSAVVAPLVVGPLLLLAAAYWYGRPLPRKRAALVLLCLPLATLLVAGAEPALRVASRIDDGNRGARRLAANGVDLVWAPEGPGWPRDGVDWSEAARRCRYLNADGNALADTPQDIWRLPSVEEAVRSQARHGENSGGVWDAARAKASYRRTPDKESPLWDVRSKVIYWWTATEAEPEKVYVISYNGAVHPRRKSARWGYQAFRAVKAPGR